MVPVLSATRRLGRTDLAVSELGFGAAALGNLHRAISDADARAMVDQAWDSGLRYVDTAPHYGLGLSERRLGAALRERPRDSFVLSTKVGRLLVPNEHPTGSDSAQMFHTPDDLRRQLDYSGPGVRRSVEESLTRLGLDRIDIALVHDPDDHVEETLDGALPELVRMREEGLVTAIGVGMNQWQAPLRFVTESDLDVVMLAGRWTLLERSGHPLMEACRERGVSVLAASPFNSGLLARPEPTAAGRFDYSAPPEPVVRAAQQLAELAREHDASLPQVALQFPLRHPAVASVVFGPARDEHVSSAAGWMSTPVPDAFWDEAETIVEGLR